MRATPAWALGAAAPAVRARLGHERGTSVPEAPVAAKRPFTGSHGRRASLNAEGRDKRRAMIRSGAHLRARTEVGGRSRICNAT